MDEREYITNLVERYPKLKTCADDIFSAYEFLKVAYLQHHKLLLAGNGGSAADAQHIAGELMKRFKLKRPLPDPLTEKLTRIDPEKGSYLAKTLEMPLTAIPWVCQEFCVNRFNKQHRIAA